MAKRCSSNAYMFKDKYLKQRRWLRRNRSWVLRNLLSSKENQEKAITYLSSQLPNDQSEQPENIANSLNTIKNYSGSCNASHHSKRSSKKSLIIPKSQTPNNMIIQSIPIFSPSVYEKKEDIQPLQSSASRPIEIDLTKTENLEEKVIDSVDDLKISKQKSESKFSKGDFSENKLKPDLNKIKKVNSDDSSNDSGADDRKSLASNSAMDIYTKSVIRELIPSDCSDDSEMEKFKHPFKRSRKRKVGADNLKKASMVRKTRSGRVYGYREVNGRRVRYNIL